VQGKRSLHPDTVCPGPADRDVAIGLAATDAHHHALKGLDALALPFNNPEMQPNGVAGTDFRELRFHLLLLDGTQQVNAGHSFTSQIQCLA
jgi:hypothetical protein